MIFKSKKIQDQIWSAWVLIPIGTCSVMYILFKRSFAKIHLNGSFLNAPIFVGEMLLFFCLLSLIGYWIKYPPQFKLAHSFILFYVIWFIFKVALGYFNWGPLAFRHAALFYSPFFALIGYIFFNRDVFIKPVIVGLFMLIICIFLWGQYDRYWTLTLTCLSGSLILGIKEKKWAILMLLILAITVPYVTLFNTARMMFVANLVSISFLTVAAFCFFKTRTVFKVCAVVLLLALVSFEFNKFFVQGESGRFYTPPGEVIDQMRIMDKTIQDQKKSFQMAPLKTGLYNPVYDKIKINYAYPGFIVPKKYADHQLEPVPAPNGSVAAQGLENPLVNQAPMGRSFLEWQSTNNIIFRLFIWRDMFEDWKVHKPLMGVDFGKPLRSPSLEILHWAQGEWGRDGWIEPHNSYFNILYRAGIVGIILVVFMWGALAWYVRLAFGRRSWILILLSAVLLNWMVAANFLLILELPYTAIPFWTLAGMSFAYACKKIDPPLGAYETKR